jgi:hypothetical protein
MSEHITHVAVFEDLWRLLKDSDVICDAFKTCLGNHYDSGLLGSGTRGNDIFAVPILELYKDQWQALADNDEVQTKIAYALGWLAHRAADRRLKLVFAEHENDPNPLFTNDGCRIYQDAMTFKMVYAGGNKNCMSALEVLSPATFAYHMQSHAGAGLIDVEKTEPLFNRVWQVDMLTQHQFFEKQDDLEGWLDLFMDRFADLTEDLRKYEQAYNNPDPLLYQRYYVDDNYYNAADDIIRYVRLVQNDLMPDMDLAQVVANAKTQSLYAQVLRQGYLFFKGASDFFTGSINQDALWQILNKRIS